MARKSISNARKTQQYQPSCLCVPLCVHLILKNLAESQMLMMKVGDALMDTKIRLKKALAWKYGPICKKNLQRWLKNWVSFLFPKPY